MTPEKLAEILRLHAAWLHGEPGGVCADIRCADLVGTRLRSANLRDADLRSANLRYTDLRDSDLSGADLRSAKLLNANLRNAKLLNANLCGADLRYTHLGGAELRGAILSGTNLDGATGIIRAEVGWSAHGELGRRLLAIADQDGPGLDVYHCGCFRGTRSELITYIAAGEERYRRSRRLALEIVDMLLADARAVGAK